MKKLLLSTAALLLSFASYSQTSLSGLIDKDSTISIENSPYSMDGDLAVMSGSKLTIESGVEIKVTGDYAFYIKGAVEMEGTEENPIVFTNQLPTNQVTWKGLVYEESAENEMLLKHVHISNASSGMKVDKAYGQMTLKNCTISNIGSGIEEGWGVGRNFKVIIDSCEFDDFKNEIAFFTDIYLDIRNTRIANGEKCIYTNYEVNIVNCSFENFSGYLAHAEGKILSSYIRNTKYGIRLQSGLELRLCTFEDNEIACTSYLGVNHLSDLIFKDNTFCNNDIDIQHNESSNIDLSGNCWCSEDFEPEDGIWDIYDDLSLGKVTYLPYAPQCDPLSAVHGTPSRLNVFPNPTAGVLNITNLEPNNTTIRVTDLFGKVISEQRVSTTNASIEIEGVAGIYMVTISSGSTINQFKVEKY